jgi:hypothetical protein
MMGFLAFNQAIRNQLNDGHLTLFCLSTSILFIWYQSFVHDESFLFHNCAHLIFKEVCLPKSLYHAPWIIFKFQTESPKPLIATQSQLSKWKNQKVVHLTVNYVVS